MKKKRSDLSVPVPVPVPSLYRCPISLDLMKSPVSLSTGITYDRSSIQKWLDAGHNTCPATMQLLTSKDLLPNHTLHRLIQIWSDSPNSEHLAADIIRGPHSTSASALPQLACFAAQSDDNRRYVLAIDGFLASLVDLICNADVELAQQALELIPAIVSAEESEASRLTDLFLTRDCYLSSLLEFLRTDHPEAAAKVLEIIASSSAESKLLLLADKEGLIQTLMNFVQQAAGTTHPILLEPVLSCLISFSTAKRIKLKLVRLGIVASISKLLTGSSSSSSSSLSVVSIERMLKLLETVSSCKDGRREICQDSRCVAALLNKTMKVSKTATEHAVTILWIVCYLFRDEKAIEGVGRNNGLTKILVVMQSNCSAGVRQMAGEVLKMLRMYSKSCLWSYDSKITSLFD